MRLTRPGARTSTAEGGTGRRYPYVDAMIRVEREGPVTTVVLDRPEVRNAVDREHAQALADAFRAFDADDEQAVAVLWGAGGTFCAGADLKALAEGRAPNR